MSNIYLENTKKSYDNNISLNIKIVIGKGEDVYMIKSKTPTLNSCTIKYDPNHELTHDDYIGSYYCTTEDELETLLNYIIGNQDIFSEIPDDSEDILDHAEICVRY